MTALQEYVQHGMNNRGAAIVDIIMGVVTMIFGYVIAPGLYANREIFSQPEFIIGLIVMLGIILLVRGTYVVYATRKRAASPRRDR